MRLHLYGRRFNHAVITSASLAVLIVVPLVGQRADKTPKAHDLPATTITVEPARSRIHFSLKGRISTFGGPADTSMNQSAILALVETRSVAGEPAVRDYFLWPPPPGITGTLRQLDPKKFYIACRWNYAKTSKTLLRQSLVTVTNPANGRSAQAKPVDWGPTAATGRIADISPGLADFLGVKVNEVVVVSFDTAP